MKSIGWQSRCELGLVEGSHQFGNTHFECPRNSDNIAQAYLSRSTLDMRNVHLADTGVLGEINLSPAALPPQLSDSFAEQDANIRCHPVMIKLSFTINLSYAITDEKQRELLALWTVVYLTAWI